MSISTAYSTKFRLRVKISNVFKIQKVAVCLEKLKDIK